MKKIIWIIIALTTAGCTDAVWDSTLGALGESANVKCYSGGQKIFEAQTTGKVGSLQGGGWAFRTTDGRVIQTFADCFVDFKK